MNTNETLKSTWERSTTRRFLAWISRWRVLRGFLFAVAALTTLVVLIYTIENWRGKRAWENFRKDAEARGEVLDWKAYVPPPVPDSENFAATPFLAPLFDFVPDPKPGESPWKNTNAYARVQAFADDLPTLREIGNWRLGERTDLKALLEEFDQKQVRHSANGDSSNGSDLQDKTADVSAALLNRLSAYDPVLDELKTASGRPYARFSLQYDLDNPANILLPHLAVTKRVCQIFLLRSLAEMSSGKSDAAAQDILFILYILNTFKNEPFLISSLVRMAEFHYAVQALWEGLADHRFSEPQLAEIQSRLSKLDFLQDMRHSLRSERAFGIKIIDWIRQSPHWARELDTLGNPESGGGNDAALFWAGLLPRGWLYFEEVNYARLFEKHLLSYDRDGLKTLDPSRAQQEGEELVRAFSRSGNRIMDHLMLSKMLLPALSGVKIKTAHGQNTLNLAETACALERHRIAASAYPERLDDLAPRFIKTVPLDVINGKPLIYRRVDGDRFVLYSIGWNEIDDGGLFESERIADSGSVAASSEPEKKSIRRTGMNLEEGDWIWKYPQR